MDNNQVEYRAVKSDAFDNAFLEDYLIVLNNAFHSNQTNTFFDRKYLENIYGPSILVVAYYNNTPVGADALWRNDIDGHLAYQSADTCVREGYRGLGIFRGLVAHKLALVEDNAIVYGFPNANSTPGFIKMGWTLIAEYRTCLFNGVKSFEEETPMVIDFDYAKYWFGRKNRYKVMRVSGKDYLVAKRSRLPLYLIIGQLAKEAIPLFERVSSFKVLLYKAKKIKWYNKQQVPTRVITYNSDVAVPVWKMDAI